MVKDKTTSIVRHTDAGTFNGPPSGIGESINFAGPKKCNSPGSTVRSVLKAQNE
jgi:hypothetical protein